MDFQELGVLLQPGYTPLETGYARRPDGVVVVAALSRVHGCTGEMIKWWHLRKKSPEEFRAWHPTEHVSHSYDDGVSFYVHARGRQILKAKVQAKPPTDYFDAAALEQSGVSFVNCARGGPAESPLWATHAIHVGRDTDYGCEVRTRFLLGDFDPPDAAPPAAVIAAMFSEKNLGWQMKHAIEEHAYLAQFLPGLFAREGPGLDSR